MCEECQAFKLEREQVDLTVRVEPGMVEKQVWTGGVPRDRVEAPPLPLFPPHPCWSRGLSGRALLEHAAALPPPHASYCPSSEEGEQLSQAAAAYSCLKLSCWAAGGRADAATTTPLHSQAITFFEEGEPLIDGEPGDLQFILRTLPWPGWERRGNDLLINHTISLVDALVGEWAGAPPAPGLCACMQRRHRSRGLLSSLPLVDGHQGGCAGSQPHCRAMAVMEGGALCPFKCAYVCLPALGSRPPLSRLMNRCLHALTPPSCMLCLGPTQPHVARLPLPARPPLASRAHPHPHAPPARPRL